MSDKNTDTSTLRELLVRIREGYSLFCPILVPVQGEGIQAADTTAEHTVTSNEPVDWAEEYTREYAHEQFLVVGSNNLRRGFDRPVTLGRSRKCDVRIENDSVSKMHAKIVFDRASGGYHLSDEGSRNGTCLNGESLVPGIATPLWSGAYVSLGDAVYVFIDPPTLRKLARVASVG